MVLTVNEVMEILRIGKRIAYEVVDQKDLPTIKIGKLKRVQRDAFFDWLKKEGVDS